MKKIQESIDDKKAKALFQNLISAAGNIPQPQRDRIRRKMKSSKQHEMALGLLLDAVKISGLPKSKFSKL